MIFSLLAFSPEGIQTDKETLWRVSASSNIKVSGESNVNEFECVTLHYKGDDMLIKRKNGSYDLNELIGSIEMKVHSFDCENRIMTRDLRETLKAEDYPNITIKIISLLIPEDMNSSGQLLKGKAEITLAGTTELVELNWRVIPENGHKIRLLSSREFTFTQFGIKPPSKMMGMIQVKDQLLVDIDFAIEKLSSAD